MAPGEWKPRGIENKPYKARKISHEANTNIEYGEKTWTTPQTVRDLMQNHLDAETDRYFRQIAAAVLDENKLKNYLTPESKERIDDLLQATHLFAKHVEDMTPETRVRSEEYLKKLALDLPLREDMKEEGAFSPNHFLDAVRPFSEERPSVSYEVIDAQTNKSIGWIAHDTLESEPLYEDTHRYRIDGMKIVDHGAGFDSQLSALYISSKTGKRHLRGKFGEGAKMSELHILRNGASMKMRSSYQARNGDDLVHNRVWQTRPKVEDGRLVSGGVEVEKTDPLDTGSMVSISLRGAKEGFRQEFLQNVDPRLGGLSKNIADFSPEHFVYPMPLDEKHLAGVNMQGEGDIQYVQGLRVDLAGDSFGYQKPWYSYNFLDSSILGGRDRNEIKSSIQDRISAFWHHNDDPELLKQLVKTAVHDSQRLKDSSRAAAELSALSSLLYKSSMSGKDDKEEQAEVKRIQKILDDALLEELGLKEHITTLVISAEDYRHVTYRETVSHARNEGYAIRITAADLSPSALGSFASRLPGTYKLVTAHEIRYQLSLDTRTKIDEEKKVIEGKREQEIRRVFAVAAASVNELMQASGDRPIEFQLVFERPEKEEVDFDNDEGRGRRRPFERPSPVTFSWGRGEKITAYINPDILLDPRHIDPRAAQREIEIYLLSAFSGEFDDETDQTELLKKSQRLLDTLIAKFISEDAALLTAIPASFEYENDPAVFERYMETIFNDGERKTEIEKEKYEAYRKALRVDLTLSEAQAMWNDFEKSAAYAAKDALSARVFLNDGVLTHWDSEKKSWSGQKLRDMRQVAEWNDLPIYALSDGRYFVPAPMDSGAVLAKGEGKNREYTFRDGESFLHIGSYSVEFGRYSRSEMAAHPAGLVIDASGERRRSGYSSDREYLKKLLAKYTYYQKGVSSREGRMIEGVSATAIPIEYGKDEWDNPIRVFQDIIQNHVDASDGVPVKLGFEIERDGKRTWVEESELFSRDSYTSAKITGLRVEDGGPGYFPNNIATMGASSKRSPLFAGKYGEGQKMVAAAALRLGLELEYQSTVQSGGSPQSWRAKAMAESRGVVLDGMEIEKKLVAFDVELAEPKSQLGSVTTLRLPEQKTPEQEKQWSEWLSIIDPRQQDAHGNAGLARYVRQLRKPDSERVHSVGSISILLDEPGAVYENGLRINPSAEGGRSLSFGYDVPEIVTTRERNSFNSDRLKHYFRHAFSHTTDPALMEEVLKKVAAGKQKTQDTNIGSILSGYDNSIPLWAEKAKEIWPGYVVHSSQKTYEDIRGEDNEWGIRLTPVNQADAKRQREKAEKAIHLEANLVHLDPHKLLYVSKDDYDGFLHLLPTAESVLQKLETVTVPAPPKVKRSLCEVVAESTKVFADMYQEAQRTLTKPQLDRYSIPAYQAGRFTREIEFWNSADAIESRNGVAIAPFGSAYHGKADRNIGVIFNEALLVGGEQRRELATTSLHEVAHILSGLSDYTEEFVTLLYDLAHYLKTAKTKT